MEQTQSGVELIAAERRRQVEQERWTPEHDAEHVDAEMSDAATCYAEHAGTQVRGGIFVRRLPAHWPFAWAAEWWKPSPDPVRNLVKAGALIAAEIDRLNRMAR